MQIINKLAKNREIMSAIFIIVFVALFILANFIVGFNLPLFMAAMAVSAIIAFLYPRSGVYAIVFLTFIFERFFTLQPVIIGMVEYKLYPIDVIFGAVILGIIYQIALNKTPFCKGREGCIKKIDYFLIAFIIIVGINFLASVFFLKTSFALAFSSFKNYAFYSLFYFAIIFLFSKKEYVIRLLKFALAGAIGIIFFIIYGIITGQGLWSEYTPLSTEGVRLLAFTHAFYLSLTLIGLFVYLLFSKKNHTTQSVGRREAYHGKIYYILVVIWAFGIIGSMMRHLWIGMAAAFLTMLLIIPPDRKNMLVKILLKYFALLIVMVLVSTYLSSLFPDSSINKLTDSVGNIIYQRVNSFSNVSSDESFFWRSIAWQEAMKEYAKSPIFGIGLGKYIYIEIDKYRDFVEARNIHNAPLIILVQMGIVAFLTFLSLIVANFKKLLNKPGKNWIDYAFIVLMLFYLAVFLFQPYLETNLLGIFFWIILGLIRMNSNVIPSVVEKTNSIPR